MEIRLHGYVCKNSFVVSPLVCFPALSSWLQRSFKHLSFLTSLDNGIHGDI